MDCMEKYGVAMIDPNKIDEFYDDLHAYLVSQNIDGVKVDVQNILETLGTGYGGRVALTHRFQQALEKSISKNFSDNSIICCMGQSTDSIYSSKVSAVTRASDDYMPRNLTSQTVHVASVAFNNIFLGEVLVPDWDMFYSVHYAAEFHAKARALGGCGIYVSDKINQHDFDLLKKLVLPDGSILRAKYPGRPTRDPVTDGIGLLKVWNLNKISGILGVFNCQGDGTWPGLNNNQSNSSPEFVTGEVSPNDIEYLDEVAGNNWMGDCAIYSFDSEHPNVISVFRNKLNQLLTTRSRDFLRLGRNGFVPPSSIWKKANYGKDVIIAHLDTGVWPESASFHDDGLGQIPAK